MPLRVKQTLVILAGVLVAAVMTWLGLWQLQVFTDQGNASAAARAQQPAVPLLDHVDAAGIVGDIYGKPITLQFIKFLRLEFKLGSIDELRAQLTRDRNTSRQILTALTSK